MAKLSAQGKINSGRKEIFLASAVAAKLPGWPWLVQQPEVVFSTLLVLFLLQRSIKKYYKEVL